MPVETGKRPSQRQWAEAEALWEAGEVTLPFLASKLKVSTSGISLHMKRRGIVRGSKAEEHKKRVAEAVTSAAIDDATVHAGRIRETKEQHYQMAAGISKLAWNEVISAKANGTPFSAIAGNLKSLDAAMTVLLKARNERWAVLGLDRADTIDNDGLPQLLISELTAEQIEDLRSREFNEFDDMAGEVAQMDVNTFDSANNAKSNEEDE
ncbi:MAG: DNA-binding protein [Betaproteobacteria bacterium]|nr:DNA-binding protein [Betaproteobacteria bacterium]